MPSTLPDGQRLPPTAPCPRRRTTAGRTFVGVYVHVPFCATRCGYRDFNTYTATELGGGATQAGYAATAVDELRLARRVLGERDLPAQTVFFGGGTPTLLPAGDLGRCSAQCVTSSASRPARK